MIALIGMVVICFVFSAFFSAAEMAFVSMNRLQLRELADSGNRSAQIILKFHDQPHQFLTTLLIANNVMNITAISLFTYGLQQFAGIDNEWVVTAFLAPLLLVFAETVPKDYGRLRSQWFLLRSSGVLLQASRIFYLPTVLILRAIDWFLKPGDPMMKKNLFVSEEEFRSLIQESTRSGVVTIHEKQLIDTILDFERLHIESAMTPVSKIPKVAITGTVGEVKELARRTQTKMVLVYEEIPSIIVGMVYVFDLLFEEKEKEGLKNFLRSPIFLPRNTSNEKAFLTLQERRQSFVVVTDERREVIGVVSIEKLLVL
ncbi:MAG TPA: CNNM domain-containing protein [bacterium]|nr:CNNM domain-containing protein [bacterium]